MSDAPVGAYDLGVSSGTDTQDAVEPSALGAEAVALLQQLIAFDTVNPPGNELPAQEHLYALLAGAGFECELLGALPERPNLVARLRAKRVAQPAKGRRAGPLAPQFIPDSFRHSTDIRSFPGPAGGRPAGSSQSSNRS